jgi:hypothetical protein
MANLSTKIKLYANQEVDFTKDVLLQDNQMVKVLTSRNGTSPLQNRL